MGISGRIAGFFLHSRLTPLIALVALLLGAFAVLVTPREEEPQIDVTMANVFIPFPGASAKDVENLVATPAEQVLARIAGIDHVYSVSRPGMAVLTVQYKVGEDGTKALVRLYDTLESHKDWLSPVLGVGAPIVKPKGIDDVPIVGLTLWTADPKRGAFELARVAHAMEVEIKRVPGTRDVATIGGPAHVVRVLMEAERMSAFGVTAQDVRAALQSSNASQPAGTLVKDNREVLVQTGAYLASAADVKQLVVGVQNGQPVFVTDVARVEDGPDLPTDYVWFGSGAAAGAKASGEHPAVTLAISIRRPRPRPRLRRRRSRPRRRSSDRDRGRRRPAARGRARNGRRGSGISATQVPPSRRDPRGIDPVALPCSRDCVYLRALAPPGQVGATSPPTKDPS
jgi:multidrug efflux pump subunit AcrB